jgi:hypothetical protein
MLTSLVLTAAVTAPAAPVPRDAVPNPVGPAPVVVYLHADASGQVMVVATKYQKQKLTRQVFVVEDGKQIQKQVEQEVQVPSNLRSTLTDLQATFTTADGAALTAEEAVRRVKAGAAVLVSADGKPVEKGWLRAAAPDTVVIASEALAGVTRVQAGGRPTTAAPRLDLFAPDADGKVKVAFNPAAAGEPIPAAVHGGLVVQGNVVVNGGNVAVNGGVLQLAPAADAPAPAAGGPRKPLDEVKFEAFTTDGKRVPREEALKRLKAGGLVLVAGDGRLPDPAYLKPFKAELLVLVSAELVGPAVPAGGGRPLPVPALAPAAVNVAPALRLQLKPAAVLVPAPKKD